jgi:hypothetical protein
MSSSSTSATTVLFTGLGKATRRGVRKCPKCGTVNGTRGLSCKNSSCDMVFKEATKPVPPPPPLVVDCCRLITGSGPERQLFSVRWNSQSGHSNSYDDQPGCVVRHQRGLVCISDPCSGALETVAVTAEPSGSSTSFPAPSACSWPPGEEFTNRCFDSILNRSSNELSNDFPAARPRSKQRNRCLESWYSSIVS